MCGILSIFSKNKAVNVGKVESGLNSIIHRGPDCQSHWLSEDKKVALGHTRLSIIDLNSGDQPISNSTNTIHLVANGEFYDFEIIREELKHKGYNFKTLSDSEIALHLYQEHGTSCLKYLRGEFAFCIWDSHNKVFFAARDRFGIKPLYYAEHDGAVYFSSEVKALFAAGVPAIWDEESYVSRAFFFRDRTLFKNVHQVPPGHFLIATNGGIRVIKYWDFNYSSNKDMQQIDNEEELISNVRTLLKDSIKTRLRSDVPLGIYLSGGIDSCAVLGLAAEQHDKTIDAFTIAFDNQEYNESHIAQEMAEKVNARFHQLVISQADLADNFSQAIWHSESLCLNSHGAAKYLLSKFVRDNGFKVVLTGEGSDEIFAGYSSFRSDFLLYQKSLQDADNNSKLEELRNNNGISAGLLLTKSRPQNIEFLRKILGFEPAWLLPIGNTIDSLKSLYNARTLNQMGDLHPIQQFLLHSDLINQTTVEQPVHTSMYLFAKSVLPNYVFPILGDRMEMAHSVEGRVPLIDHKLVETIVKMPITMKIKGKTEKYILREAARPYLIDKVYNRQKHPFLTPPSIFNPKEKLHQLAQDTLRSNLTNEMPFFNPKKVIHFLDNIHNVEDNSKIAMEALLMEMLSLCMLQKHFSLSHH